MLILKLKKKGHAIVVKTRAWTGETAHMICKAWLPSSVFILHYFITFSAIGYMKFWLFSLSNTDSFMLLLLLSKDNNLTLFKQ